MEQTLVERLGEDCPLMDVVKGNVELLKERLPHCAHMDGWGEEWSTTYFLSYTGHIEYVGRYHNSGEQHRTRWSQWAVIRGVRQHGRYVIESMHVPGYDGLHSAVLHETMRRYNEGIKSVPAADVENVLRTSDN
jgi:hypothetical protein